MLANGYTITARRPTLDACAIGKSTRGLGGRLHGVFGGCRLSSVYQPVFSVAHKRVVGYEALLRPMDEDERLIPVEAFLGLERAESEAVLLDRLARYIHVSNFLSLSDRDSWLFLNVSPATVIHGPAYGPFFLGLLERFGLPAHRVVIEVVEHPMSTSETVELSNAVAYYRDIGCLVAVDDFGAGHSNFERIWSLKPDIVKLARSMLTGPGDMEEKRNLLQGMVGLLHQAGSLVVMEGVQTTGEALLAMESDADFVQGYYFGFPSENPADEALGVASVLGPLFDQYKDRESCRVADLRSTLGHFGQVFGRTIDLLRGGASIAEALTLVFESERVVRCYLVKSGGQQLGETVVSPGYSTSADPRFRPLEDAQEADWSRRPYLQRAIMNPGQLQMTRPYLSIAGAHMCTTLSMAFSADKGDMVLCADISC